MRTNELSSPQRLRVHCFKCSAGCLHLEDGNLPFTFSPEPVLATFQTLTSICILVSADKLRTIPSPGVAGVYTTDQALAQCLRGTGVRYRFNSPKLVTLELQELAASVEILDSISLSSPKYSAPVRDTAQMITLIPKSVTEEQGATTLRDVLRNVTGLTMMSGFPRRGA